MQFLGLIEVMFGKGKVGRRRAAGSGAEFQKGPGIALFVAGAPYI